MVLQAKSQDVGQRRLLANMKKEIGDVHELAVWFKSHNSY